MTSGEKPAVELPLETRRYTGRDVLVIAGLAALIALAFWEVVFQGRVFFFRDFSHFFYPKRLVVAEALRHWRIPFWNSVEGCGTPVFGTYQVAAFYPPALIYYLLPMPQSFMWFVVFHFFLSGVGAYYMMRVWGARRLAAAFTAFAWAFCPAFVATLDFVSFQTSLSWLPWCLAFTRKIATGGGFKGYLLLSISFAMAIMAAAPEPVIFISILIAGYSLWSMVSGWYRRGFSSAWRPVALVAAAMTTAVLLSGVELVPFLYTLVHSARQKPLLIEDAGSWSGHPMDAWLLFLPRFYLYSDRGGIYWPSQAWLKGVYLGVLVPFLVFWTLFAVRRRRNLFFAVVVLIFLVMALGPYTPVWTWCYQHLPGIGHIRFPVKFYLPAAFGAAVLAGFAVDDFLICARRREKLRIAVLVVGLLVIAALFTAAWAVMNWDTERVFKMITPRALYDLGEAGADEAAECYEATQWSFGRSAAHLAIGAAALLIAAAIARFRIPRPYGGIALTVALFVDIGMFGAHLNPVAGPEVYTETPGHIEIVPHGVTDTRLFMTPELDLKLSMERLYRINDLVGLRNYVSLLTGKSLDTDEDILKYLKRTSIPPFKTGAEVDEWLKTTRSTQFLSDLEQEVWRETFYPSANLMYRVPEVDAFEPLRPRRHHDLIQRMLFHQTSPGREFHLARMWGASVVIDILPDAPGFVYIPMDNPGTRAVLADHVVPVKDDAEAEATIAETDLDLTRRIVLVGAEADAATAFLGPSAREIPGTGLSAPGAAHVLFDDGNSCAFEVDASKRALVFIADNWFPNFAARVDGKSAPIWRANYAYRAVPVEPGRHTVEFTWSPYDFYAGAAVTILSIVALAIFSRVRRRSP